MPQLKASETQLLYARVLDIATKTGFLFLVLSFLLYISGLLSPYIPLKNLPQYWGMPVAQFLKETGIHPGWAWMGRLNHGDFFSFLGLSFLGGVTIICYIAVVPRLFKTKEYILVSIVLVEIVVLLLAASGLLQVGGH